MLQLRLPLLPRPLSAPPPWRPQSPSRRMEARKKVIVELWRKHALGAVLDPGRARRIQLGNSAPNVEPL